MSPRAAADPLKVLFVSKGHQFDREGLMAFFDSPMFRQPDQLDARGAAGRAGLLRSEERGDVRCADVLRCAWPHRPTTGPDGKVTFDDAAPDAKVAFAQMLMAGKPLVFFHHSLAAWVHTVA
jgi:hypothetical protein